MLKFNKPDIKTSARNLWKEIRKNKVNYLFCAPYFILFCIFTIVPVAMSMFLSFTSFNILEPPVFVGLQNYVRLFFEDRIFMEKAISNTFVIAAIVGPVGYMICLFLAWMLNELPRILRMIFTLIFFAPTIAGNIYFTFTYLFNNDSQGYVNALLIKYGIIQSPILWFQDEKYMVTLIIVICLWTSIGTTFLSFIAGLQGIPAHYYEAGAIDGIKNRWQELWYITLPSMKPQLMFGAVMSITGAFGVGSIVTALCGLPSTNYAAHTVMNHLEDFGNVRFEMGYASSIATVLFVIMIGTNALIKRMLSKVGE
ncbi:MAG: sugar ABC transporter permease [Lachnospiraceae bacterium]|nr:sugar ABC transporter permease [Lachnospiraceae bacterium]